MKTRRAECKTGKRQGQPWNLAGERLESRGGRQVSARRAGAAGRCAPGAAVEPGRRSPGEQGRQAGERQGLPTPIVVDTVQKF